MPARRTESRNRPRRYLRSATSPARLAIEDIMSVDVVAVGPEDTVRKAAETLSTTGVAGVPVMVRGKVIGVVTGADLVTRFAGVGGPESDVLDEHIVSEVMSHRVYALGPETPVRDAARYMMAAGIRRVLVMRDKRLLGIVSMSDVVRAVAEHRL